MNLNVALSNLKENYLLNYSLFFMIFKKKKNIDINIKKERFIVNYFNLEFIYEVWSKNIKTESLIS